MRLNKGTLDDQVGMPVVTSKGVVGRVIRSGSKYSDVHLLIDINFNIDVNPKKLARTVLNGNNFEATAN